MGLLRLGYYQPLTMKSEYIDIEFRNVTFSYAGSEKPALKNINLTVHAGEIVLITGPAGSGKTTLCNCMNGLIPHYHEGHLEGEVLVRSYRTRKARIGGLASLVGMVFQDPESQLVTSSVADEVAFGLENFGVPREEINRRVAAALKATRLEGYEDREPYNLSGGEQQACVIAAVYAMQPEIYVMDEPLANLDPSGRKQVLQLIIDVAKKRDKTLVIVEHALEEVLPWVDRVVVLNRGEIILDQSVKEALEHGDILHVFTRPPIVRLAEKYHLHPYPLSAEDFYNKLRSKYELDTFHFDNDLFPPKRSSLARTDQTPVIEFSDVCFSYNKQFAALDHINLKVYEGELLAILGRNGSGKTTLVRHIIGLLQPDEGTVKVLGKDVSQTPTHILAQDVGFCFQNPNHQIVSFNVRDEMTFGLKAHNIDPNEYEQRIHEALEIVDMVDYLDAEIFDLGKGQKQRIALASVLTLRPRILIIDEPTTGQDPMMTAEIFEIIKRLNEQGTTVLMITHNVDYAAAYASRAIVLRKGHISFDGSMQDLMTDLELMEANSLLLPSTTQLARLLSAHGVPPWLVRYEELEAALDKIVKV